MKVRTASKLQFDGYLRNHSITDENVETFNDLAFISITSTGDYENSYLKEDHKNYLKLKFDDINAEEYRLYNDSQNRSNELTLFTEEMAEQIIDFIWTVKAKVCLVHCSAGVSRSGAVGTFIHECFKSESDEEFNRTNQHIHPKEYIIEMLRNTLELRP